jgi:cell wall-associated NlpC family hydrolase
MPDKVMRLGDDNDAVRALQAATNRRLQARELDASRVDEDGELGPLTLDAVRKAAWALGALSSTYEAVVSKGEVPVGVQRLILNPGKRSAEQLGRAKARMSQMRAERKRRAEELAKAGAARTRIVDLAVKAAANYRRNPAAYHYLMGGKANLVFLKPSPNDFRSDCSQFVASVYSAAHLPSPASVEHKFASTFSMVAKGKRTAHPRPGDLGMYGTFAAPHHVELYVGKPGAAFIGHGSPPIDSMTPGRPDYYLTYDCLD